MSLETTEFGKTGIQVTRLGYGAMELRNLPETHAQNILNLVLDSGINFIDTSIDYGESENLIGKYISHRRNQYFLASKCGCPVGNLKEHIFTKDNIEKGIDQSLKRMKTDYLDLVQLHASPSKALIDRDDVINTLLSVQKKGKVKFIGSSSVLPSLIDLVEMKVFDAFQIPYSALNREHEEWITNAHVAGAGTIIRGGVSKGISTEVADQNNVSNEWKKFWEAKLGDLMENNESPTAFILRFTLSHPSLNTTIVGTKNAEHLNENIHASNKGKLSQDIYEQAKCRLENIGVQPIPGI